MDNLDGKLIKKLIEEHEIKRDNYKLLYDRYKGIYPILQKKVSNRDKTNNKLVVNFDKNTIDTIVGYFVGKPIVVQHDKSNKIQEVLDEIFAENDKDDLFAEVIKEANIKGKSYMFIYQNEFGETKMKKVSPEEIIVNRDNNGDVESVFRYYYLKNIEDDKLTLYVEAYKGNKVFYYIQDEKTGEIILDFSRPNPTTHIFQRVPFVEVVNNEEEQGEGEITQSLVDAYNKILSYEADEHEAYRNSYLVIKNMTTTEDALMKFKEQSMVFLEKDGEFGFATKNSNNQSTESHLDRLEKKIQQTTQVINLSDENFGGNLSGIAIKLKLIGLETKCITKERKFTKAIKDILKILRPIVKLKTGENLSLMDVDIQFTRNIPANLLEYADIVVKLNATGLIDKETLLSLLPFISDPLAILEKVEAEQGEYVDFHKILEEVEIEKNNVI